MIRMAKVRQDIEVNHKKEMDKKDKATNCILENVHKWCKERVSVLKSRLQSVGKRENLVTTLRTEIRQLKSTNKVDYDKSMHSQLGELLGEKQVLMKENDELKQKNWDLQATTALLKVNCRLLPSPSSI
jgi:hypothetical protein